MNMDALGFFVVSISVWLASFFSMFWVAFHGLQWWVPPTVVILIPVLVFSGACAIVGLQLLIDGR